ncbi:MAG: phosphoribosylaminoimidazolesuccinocarboxamide synthase [candidate division WOR-3 bacterium]|nr:phosphoribosylaminoimidazolesuccinocarboxamide synthase [candidate division WOR-3 bacterium]MCX7947849.1 phosphoribosylaminoimidazolesuccinocarboxamide synthase [candidate division WOR-3 bacterium]MDW8150671.1 phosphoribosylaminoimidazolesuccinocarboxamide synthase [candidate division WOR-3 bacterium]
MEILHKGKIKSVYRFSDDIVIIEFSDYASAFNGKKFQTFEGKGVLNAKFSSFFFELLSKSGLKNHYIKRENNRIYCKKLNMFKMEIVVRNIATGSIVKRLGIENKYEFKKPILEFFYKNDELNDPLICREHIYSLNLANEEELRVIEDMAMKANSILLEFFKSYSLKLVDIKFEFGKYNDEILLGDEISPDIFRVWDENGNSYDKDVFRFDKGNLIEAYRKLSEIINI